MCANFFSGVSLVNGFPTSQFKILRGCRQGDPIAGYLFVLCIEILALTIQNSNVIPYKTIKGNEKQNDTYADDLTLFLKLFKNDDKKNKENIKAALDCFSLFSSWSGLNINKNKTYLNIFGQESPEPPYVKELGLNYCNEFTLLGITYDSTLTKMMCNYEAGLRKLEIVANDWRHKYLTIFGKITVVKTFMLSILSHVATVLPTPSNAYCKKFEKVMVEFIKGEKEKSETDDSIKLKASIVSQDVLFAPKSHNGLGLQRVSIFWSAIKMSWLRRLEKPSFWKTLHIEDLKDKSLLFNPYNSNELLMEKSFKKYAKSSYETNLHFPSNL